MSDNQLGQLAILNVGSGDTKLSFDPKNKAEAKRAANVVADMLKRGFCILVEVGRDSKGPLYRRVRKFDPKTAEYIIAGDPPDPETVPHVQKPSSAPPSSRKGKSTARVSAAKSSAVAVAPTAGG